jgi:hypothetical protein
VGPLITPSEQATLQVEFIWFQVVEDPLKSPHHSPGWPIVILFLGLVNEVEVTTQDPGATNKA